jgi:hypothetical protein
MRKRKKKLETQAVQVTQQALLSKPWLKFTAYVFLIFVLTGLTATTFFVIQGERIAYRQSQEGNTQTEPRTVTTEFPVSVDPVRKEIVVNPGAEEYFAQHIQYSEDPTSAHTSFLGRTLGTLALMNWYQNLASVSSRILVIQSGERKEQVADNFGKILKWNNAEKKEFLGYIEGAAPAINDGKFYPGTYSVSKNAKPAEVAPLILDRFNNEVLSRYTDNVSAVVPIDEALTIASLLEREAYDFNDMRQNSGVIWNRLFIDMRLQIDATLQYAKGSKPSQPWWPQVLPADKNIASVYNTYKNAGLPPGPIANPSMESILAALNPVQTDCMYYFHDADSVFHCTKTYEEHVALLKQYYGRGR